MKYINKNIINKKPTTAIKLDVNASYENYLKRYYSSTLQVSINESTFKFDRLKRNGMLKNKTDFQNFRNQVQKVFMSNLPKIKKIHKSTIWIPYFVPFVVHRKLNPEKLILGFRDEILHSGKVEIGKSYSCIIKLVAGGDIWLVVSKTQRHFKLDLNIESYDKTLDRLLEYTLKRLDDILWKYNSILAGIPINFMVFEFYQIDTQKKLLKTISNLDIINKDEILQPSVNILDIHDNYFGNSLHIAKGIILEFGFDDNNDVYFVNNDHIDRGLLTQLFSSTGRSDNPDYNLNSESKIYILSPREKNYILVEDIVYDDDKDSKSLLVANKHEKEERVTVWKRCFNEFGDLIYEVKDKETNTGKLIRTSGNTQFIYNSKRDKIIYTDRRIEFKSIKSKYLNKINEKNKWLFDARIGVFDTETYTDNDISLVYSLGFYTSLNKSCETFYIDKRTLDSDSLIHTCIHEMLQTKYNGYTFYCHNLGGFDAPFIIKALSNYNKNLKENPYLFEIISRDSNIIKLVIKRKFNNRYRRVVIKDSYAILPNDLRTLGKDFEVPVTKSYFPYTYVKSHTLFYKGSTPDKFYYNDISLPEYNNLYSDNWSLQDECIKYLEKDLLSLHQVLVKANITFNTLFDLHMSDSLTISSLSSKFFLDKHYNKEKSPLPLIVNSQIWSDIHKAYYGGRVEVYIPIFNSAKANNTLLYHYDVNSLYPFASLNKMPGLKANYISFYENNELKDLNKLFGFFYCKVKASTPDIYNSNIGLLPKRGVDNLIFPLGEWEGWYFSEELKYAKTRGYEIEVIKGYSFSESNNVFDGFVNNVNYFKTNPKNNTEKKIAKLVLNSLIGRFGMNFDKNITSLVNQKEFNKIMTTRAVSTAIEINEDLYIISYSPGIKQEICESFGTDFLKAMQESKRDEKTLGNIYSSVSISTAAAVLGYARIHMSKIFEYVQKNNGKIYYTDTDSIFTDIKLPDHLIDGKKLGLLKLEDTITEACFISDKLYYYINTNGDIVKKARGVDSSKLGIKEYKDLYHSEVVTNATKKQSVRNYAEGSVTIITKTDISLTSKYTKRNKVIYNGLWVDTTPLILTLNNSIMSLTLTTKLAYLSLIPYNAKLKDLNLISYTPKLVDDLSLIPYNAKLKDLNLISYTAKLKDLNLISYTAKLKDLNLISYTPKLVEDLSLTFFTKLPNFTIVPYQKLVDKLSLVPFYKPSYNLSITPYNAVLVNHSFFPSYIKLSEIENPSILDNGMTNDNYKENLHKVVLTNKTTELKTNPNSNILGDFCDLIYNTLFCTLATKEGIIFKRNNTYFNPNTDSIPILNLKTKDKSLSLNIKDNTIQRNINNSYYDVIEISLIWLILVILVVVSILFRDDDTYSPNYTTYNWEECDYQETLIEENEGIFTDGKKEVKQNKPTWIWPSTYSNNDSILPVDVKKDVDSRFKWMEDCNTWDLDLLFNKKGVEKSAQTDNQIAIDSEVSINSELTQVIIRINQGREDVQQNSHKYQELVQESKSYNYDFVELMKKVDGLDKTADNSSLDTKTEFIDLIAKLKDMQSENQSIKDKIRAIESKSLMIEQEQAVTIQNLYDVNKQLKECLTNEKT